MNEKEIMVNEAMENTVANGSNPEMSTGAAMLLGSVLTIATIAGVKQLKKMLAKVKAKKEASKAEESEVIEVTDSTEVEDQK